MTSNKPLHHPLMLTSLVGITLFMMPVWLSVVLTAAAVALTLIWLVQRHWSHVCYACQVCSEFIGFCLLVAAFIGLSLGLTALVDVPAL